MIYKEILNNAQYVNTYCFNLTKCIERCLSINCIRKYAEHIRVRNSEKMPQFEYTKQPTFFPGHCLIRAIFFVESKIVRLVMANITMKSFPTINFLVLVTH